MESAYRRRVQEVQGGAGMKYDVYIGIDPDSVKSGVAYVERETGVCETTSLPFHQVLSYLEFVKKKSEENGQSVVVVVEAGWLNESNWHLLPRDNKYLAAAKGKGLGRCEQTGRLILEMAEHVIGLPCIARKPLRKCWKGKDRKITQEEIAEFTGLMGRTNQEGRDALLLAWVEADLPIKVKVT